MAEPINGEVLAPEPVTASRTITAAQLALVEVALNVAAMQFELSAVVVNGNGAPDIAQKFGRTAIAMRELAALIKAKAVVGSSIIRPHGSG